LKVERSKVKLKDANAEIVFGRNSAAYDPSYFE